MKSKYVILASALLISVIAFAQKDQIKAAEKVLKSGNSADALAVLKQAESLISSATDAEKAQYFFVKGNILNDLASKNGDYLNDQIQAAKSYNELISIEKASGKSKYTEQAQTALTAIKGKLLNKAIEVSKDIDNKVLACLTTTDKILADYKLTLNSKTQKEIDELLEKKKSDLTNCEKIKYGSYGQSSKLLYSIYELDKTDHEKLYYAASYAINAQDFDTALGYYEELKKENYSGEGTSYYAKSVLTENEDYFGTTPEAKADRDSKVKLKVYNNPRDEKIPSKRGEIYKNIALILVQEGKIEEAKKAIGDARKTNPEDTSLILTEANLYLEAKDYETYKKIVGEALEKNPNNVDLIFNLGVISANAKNPADAEKYYKNAIEVDPKYINAYINLAALKLDNEKVIIDEMNKLGTSAKDMKRYDVLKAKREELFKGTIPYLQKAVELDPANIDVSKTLLNVYSALEMMPEAKALKEKIKMIEPKK